MQTTESTDPVRSPAIVCYLLALGIGSLGVTPISAATFVVTSSANNGPGTLRTALAAPPDVTLITFDPSLSGATIYLASELTINKDVTIDGSALASKITITGDSDGNGTGDVRVFSTTGFAYAFLKSLIIEKGVDSGLLGGGGIRNTGILSLVDISLSGSTSNEGGGIYNTGFISLTNVTVSGNSAVTGGGIYNGGTLSIASSTITGNNATGLSGGGGIFSTLPGSVTLANSTLSSNAANGTVNATGGGITNSGIMTIASSTLSGNSSYYGGGIINNYSLTVTNSTIAANSSKKTGGGIYENAGAVANVYNTSIVYNVADSDADDVGVAGGVYGNGTFNMRNTLIAGNSVGGAPVYDDCGGEIRSYGRDLVGALSTTTGGFCSVVSVVGSWTKLNDLNLLGILQNNGGPTRTVALLPGSNAIDGADAINGCTDVNGAVIAADQRGVVRPQGVRCDVGAYEYASPTDTDLDGVADVLDNCTLVVNQSQLDADHDGYGNICDGDLNNSGLVTSQDNTLLRNVLNQPISASTTAAAADMNGSGLVTSQDNTLLRNRLNTAPGPSGLACAGTIPCP